MLSDSEIVLYTHLFDLAHLSFENSKRTGYWVNTNGEVFVHCTLESAQKVLNCGHDKASKVLRELERAGLIKRRSRGNGSVHVKLVISKPGQTTATLYTEEKFREEYGFEPKKLIDLKALMGDSSDNIPGVAGVGPKTAKDLLMKFGSMDGVYEHIEDPSIRPKLREKLENDREKAYLSYDLATMTV